MAHLAEGQPAAEVQEECAHDGRDDNARVEHVEHILGARTAREWWALGVHSPTDGKVGGEQGGARSEVGRAHFLDLFHRFIRGLTPTVAGTTSTAVPGAEAAVGIVGATRTNTIGAVVAIAV